MTAARKALMKWVASIAFVAVVILLLLVVNDADIVIVLGLVLFFLAAPMLVLLTIDCSALWPRLSAWRSPFGRRTTCLLNVSRSSLVDLSPRSA